MLRNYWTEQATLTVQDGLLLKGSRLVIPSVMRNEVLAKIHEGHQGVVKCKERARQSVWWPGLSQQVAEMVLRCRTCIKERQNPKEPLMVTEKPERPWQKLGCDLFSLRGKTYLLVVDYFSRYVEVAQMSHTKSTDAIVHLKSIFARHGIPEFFRTDNGPQYSGRVFADFAAEYGFKHITSSPGFPQSNGEVERAVQTVKNLLKKASDPYLALLAYRATPLQSGYSPAQLLMGRRLRTTVPTLPSELDPALPDSAAFALKENERARADVERYNRRHRARALGILSPGEQVWVTDAKSPGTVLQNHSTPRSYMVDLPQGVVRRNRRHLLPLPSPTDGGGSPPQQRTETETIPPAVVPQPDTVPRTRSGRAVIKPDRLGY